MRHYGVCWEGFLAWANSQQGSGKEKREEKEKRMKGWLMKKGWVGVLNGDGNK